MKYADIESWIKGSLERFVVHLPSGDITMDSDDYDSFVADIVNEIAVKCRTAHKVGYTTGYHHGQLNAGQIRDDLEMAANAEYYTTQKEKSDGPFFQK